MKFKTVTIICVLYTAIFLFAQRRPVPPAQLSFSRVVDLTHALSEKNPNYEGTRKSPFEARQLGRIDKEGWYSRHVSLPEHFGTHLDAPAHFGHDRWTVDEIPPERLVRDLVILDVRGKCQKNPDYQITVDDIAEWEKKHGHIPAGAVVVANTGWAKCWNDMRKYRGADEGQWIMHFPGFHIETVEFLVQARQITGIGIDTMGVDYGASETYPVHKYTAAHSVYHVENVANLDQVPEAGAVIIVAPMKLERGSGAPVRLLALVP